jgi:hypothetical protein
MKELFLVISLLINLFFIVYSILKMKKLEFKRKIYKYILLISIFLIPIIGFLVTMYLLKKNNNPKN